MEYTLVNAKAVFNIKPFNQRVNIFKNKNILLNGKWSKEKIKNFVKYNARKAHFINCVIEVEVISDNQDYNFTFQN